MEHLFRFYADKDERNLWESALYDITSVSGKKKLAYLANGGHIYISIGMITAPSEAGVHR